MKSVWASRIFSRSGLRNRLHVRSFSQTAALPNVARYSNSHRQNVFQWSLPATAVALATSTSLFVLTSNHRSAQAESPTGPGGRPSTSQAPFMPHSQRAQPSQSAQDSENEAHHKRKRKQLKIFSGTANIPLAQEIADKLGTQLGKITVKTFADGEIGIQVHENVRGKDVYLIQPSCPPGVNDHLMELILMISTMRRASARKITAIIPYYGYARQDRKMQARVPISAAEVARMLEAMGVDRVVAVDLHCGQIQGFFGPRTPCDNLEGAVVALPYFLGLDLTADTVIVSPDAGGVNRAKKFRDLMKNSGVDAGLAMIIKQRSRANAIEQMDLVGSVEDKNVIIVDDMIDTAGTLCKAGAELKRRGANRIFAFATHGLFSGPAINRIRNSEFEKVVVCNTIPLPDKNRIEQIDQLSIASLLAQAIERIHYKESVSQLFDPKTHMTSEGKELEKEASSGPAEAKP